MNDLTMSGGLGSPRSLFTPAFTARQHEPQGALLAALTRNDTCHFHSAVPVRLYVGGADRDVPPANAAVCRQRLAANGSVADIVDVGAVDHRTSLILALPRLLDWSSSLTAPAPSNGTSPATRDPST